MLGEGPPAPARPDAGLRLRAEDADDLAVISACLQDALVSVRDLAYDRDAKTFVLVTNRFRWEEGGAGRARGVPRRRILCGVEFDGVENVIYRGFRRSEKDRILALLAICPVPEEGGTIDLEFAAGATIRLTVPAIRCRARDFGEPWPTRWRPDHLVNELR